MKFTNFVGNLREIVLQNCSMVFVYMYIILADKMYATPSGIEYNRSLPPEKQVGLKLVHLHC